MITFSGEDSERCITLRGHPRDMEALATELQAWTPVGGWSLDAEELFALLKGERD